MNILKLSDIATIRSGHTFREKLENQQEGDCSVIQMKDVDTAFHQVKDTALKTHIDTVPKNQLLNQSDVLFLAKGFNNVALVFQKEYPAVASSVFFVIRPIKEKIDSEYLVWYLNQGPIKNQLKGAKVGTTVTNINKKSLEDLEIKVPSLLTQKKLVNMYKLWLIEKEQTQRLLVMKDRFYNNLVLHEIDLEPQVEAFTDDASLWIGYELSALYYRAQIKFKESIFIKGVNTSVKEVIAIIIDMNKYSRTIEYPDGSTRTYPAVKDWEFILPGNLKAYNDATITKNQKEDFINLVPHSLIESITMLDRYGNEIPIESMTLGNYSKF